MVFRVEKDSAVVKICWQYLLIVTSLENPYYYAIGTIKTAIKVYLTSLTIPDLKKKKLAPSVKPLKLDLSPA